MIELLVAEGYRTDNVTAPAIYYHLDRRPRTALLIDEADNLDLFRNGVLRSGELIDRLTMSACECFTPEQSGLLPSRTQQS